MAALLTRTVANPAAKGKRCRISPSAREMHVSPNFPAETAAEGRPLPSRAASGLRVLPRLPFLKAQETP